MVVKEQIPSQSEVESALRSDEHEHPRNHSFPSIGRQSSIYALTLDEFQHTLCDGGKNFGSMNMDEFLNSIWTAEENQAHAAVATTTAAATTTTTTTSHSQFPTDDKTTIAKQPSLSRQGSLTLPPPLCRKTVDEVWSEIHKTQQEPHPSNLNSAQNSGSSRRQPTFGEMTLEDFLVKAGVVREQGHPPPPPQPQPFSMYQNSTNPMVGTSFINRPVMGLSGGGSGGVNGGAYQTMPQSGVGEAPLYLGNGKRSGGYQTSAVCYGGIVGNNGNGFGQVQPLSPASSDGMCASLEMGVMRGGRKRIMDGPVEKVVERRQRRMIKNRESAARSRARKQAYTVELEAELNQLKEENAQLKQALKELERKRKQQYIEEMKIKAQTKAQKSKEKLRMMRRNLSCPY